MLEFLLILHCVIVLHSSSSFYPHVYSNSSLEEIFLYGQLEYFMTTHQGK